MGCAVLPAPAAVVGIRATASAAPFRHARAPGAPLRLFQHVSCYIARRRGVGSREPGTERARRQTTAPHQCPFITRTISGGKD